jgi:maltooligosyltrehalose trehalohydrolase
VSLVNALMWLRDYHFDGLRIDERSQRPAGSYASGKSAAMVSTPSGAMISSRFTLRFKRRAHRVLRRFRLLGRHGQSTSARFVYNGRYSAFRRRRHGRAPSGLPGHSFLGYLQTHDQIINRAKGERSSQLISVGRLKISAALVLTGPLIPMLFQGEEWGATSPFLYFTDHEDPELARNVREGRRREFSAFGWNPEDISDPQAVETFERSKLT